MNLVTPGTWMHIVYLRSLQSASRFLKRKAESVECTLQPGIDLPVRDLTLTGDRMDTPWRDVNYSKPRLLLQRAGKSN